MDRRARGGARNDPEDPTHYIGHLHSVLALRKRIARIRERASGAPQLNSLNVRIEFRSEQSRLPDDSHPKRRPWQAIPQRMGTISKYRGSPPAIFLSIPLGVPIGQGAQHLRRRERRPRRQGHARLIEILLRYFALPRCSNSAP